MVVVNRNNWFGDSIVIDIEQPSAGENMQVTLLKEPGEKKKYVLHMRKKTCISGTSLPRPIVYTPPPRTDMYTSLPTYF
jgi:hypothetical protein